MVDKKENERELASERKGEKSIIRGKSTMLKQEKLFASLGFHGKTYICIYIYIFFFCISCANGKLYSARAQQTQFCLVISIDFSKIL